MKNETTAETKVCELREKLLNRAKDDMTSGEYEVSFEEDYLQNSSTLLVVFKCHVWKVEYIPRREQPFVLYKINDNLGQTQDTIIRGQRDPFFENLWHRLIQKRKYEQYANTYEQLTKIAKEVGLDVLP